MTPAERRAALVEKMARAMRDAVGANILDLDDADKRAYDCQATAALTVALEEAAKELDGWGDIYGDNAAAAIRALIWKEEA
jgi:hypothetical protein